jgi:signal transduction histidine kinase
MSYRSIKRLLGETSLERKCRFLFGGSLMLLITGSFYFYAQLNLQILRDQNREQASLLVAPSLLAAHSRDAELDEAYRLMFEELTDALQAAPDVLQGYTFELYKPNPAEDSSAKRPGYVADWKAVQELALAYERTAELPENERLTLLEKVVEDRKTEQYHYYRVVLARASCIDCHRERARLADLQVGDMLGVAQITFPLSKSNREIKQNNAILIAMALFTASLAMAAAYAVVRYIIVKPVLHLKDVSDAIAHGELDQRADIRTGDEFEELSHAFNRMLRHLVTVQDELREVNTHLDAKVDQLAQANLSLHEMNKIKSEFLATMSHELRTPLNSILGFSDILSEADNLSDKQRKFVSNITTSGRSLLSLINDILDLAKIEAGKMQVHLVEFSVADLVERLTTSIRPLSERKNIDLRTEVDPQLPLACQDAGKLHQILGNLLSNAVKFTPEGGRILVQALWEPEPGDADSTQLATSAATAGWITLIVADTGIGIPLDDQAAIFEKFRQGSVTQRDRDPLTREYEGTGLGLSIVKELTRLLGGTVELESEFGKGSTFTVRIPPQIDPGSLSRDEAFAEPTVEFRPRHPAALPLMESPAAAAPLAKVSSVARDAG